MCQTSSKQQVQDSVFSRQRVLRSTNTLGTPAPRGLRMDTLKAQASLDPLTLRDAEAIQQLQSRLAELEAVLGCASWSLQDVASGRRVSEDCQVS